MIALGSNTIDKFYKGSAELEKVYFGSTQIWPTDVSFTTSDLTFTTNTNLLNTSQVFSSNGGGFGFGHTGLDSLSLASNQNGRIYSEIQANDASDFVLGFNQTNAQTGFAGMEIAYDRQAGTTTLFRLLSSTFYDTGITFSNGDHLGIYRVGPMFKFQRSSDGLTWTDIPEAMFALTYSYSGQIWPVCDLHTTAKIYNPKIDIYETGDLARLIIQDGDSIGAGLFSGSDFSKTNLGFQGYSSLQDISETFYKNVAVTGSSLVSRNSALSTDVFPLFGQTGNSFDKIIVSINCGVNDLNSQSPATVYSNLMTYVNNVLNEDSRTCVMIYTVINCDSAYVADADRLTYNALVTGTTQTARLKVVDVSGEPLLNNSNAYQSSTYYQADGVHQKQPGIDLLYSIAEPVLLSF